MEDDVNTQEQEKNRNYDHIKPWQFKPGQSGNPGGRPKGSISLKEWVRKMLYEMDDEERIEFLKGIDKKVLWEMSEGKPETKTDITSGGEKIVFMPQEVINRMNGGDKPTQ